jgi:hypothetical protein
MKNLILLFTALLMLSCVGTKTISEKSLISKSTDNIDVKHDTQKETKINKGINAQSGISLKTGDSLVNSRIREAMRNYNYSNQSGSNSTNVKFDEESMALLIANIVGETSDTKETDTKTTIKEKTFEQQTDEYLSKKIVAIPWWLWLIVGWFLLPKVIETYGLIISPFKKKTNASNQV